MSFNPNSVLVVKDKLLFHLVFLSHTFPTSSEVLVAYQPSQPVSIRPPTGTCRLSVVTQSKSQTCASLARSFFKKKKQKNRMH